MTPITVDHNAIMFIPGVRGGAGELRRPPCPRPEVSPHTPATGSALKPEFPAPGSQLTTFKVISPTAVVELQVCSSSSVGRATEPSTT